MLKTGHICPLTFTFHTKVTGAIWIKLPKPWLIDNPLFLLSRSHRKKPHNIKTQTFIDCLLPGLDELDYHINQFYVNAGFPLSCESISSSDEYMYYFFMKAFSFIDPTVKCALHSVAVVFILTPAPERGCVIAAARGWRLWGTQQRRCLLSSWPRSSSCWALLSVEGDGNETPCVKHTVPLSVQQLPDSQGKHIPQISLLSHRWSRDDKRPLVKSFWKHNLLHFSVFYNKNIENLLFFPDDLPTKAVK